MTSIETDNPNDYDSDIRDIYKDKEFISASKCKTDFFADFFQTRLWVTFLEMKITPEQLMHWIKIKIFDENIIKKENRYYLKFKKVETPFLDENKKKRIFNCMFNPPSSLSTPERLEDKYYNARDSQNTLIKTFISTDPDLVTNGFFLYYSFPCFVESILPNPSNFPVEQFAPDLSKEYVQNEKMLQNLHFTHKTNHYLNTIKCDTVKDDMVVIWTIMWCMCFRFIQALEEKQFRVDQLVGLLLENLNHSKTFKQPLPLFEDVLNTLLKHGDLQMVTQVIVLMNTLKIKRNSTIDNIFFMAVRKFREVTKKKSDKKSVEAFKPIKISDIITEMEKQKMARKMYGRCIETLISTNENTIKTKSTFMRRTFKPYKVIF